MEKFVALVGIFYFIPAIACLIVIGVMNACRHDDKRKPIAPLMTCLVPYLVILYFVCKGFGELFKRDHSKKEYKCHCPRCGQDFIYKGKNSNGI